MREPHWDSHLGQVSHQMRQWLVLQQDGQLVRVNVGEEPEVVFVAQNAVWEVNVLEREHPVPLRGGPQPARAGPLETNWINTKQA